MSGAPSRVVVVGHGMVGSRFVEELVERHDPTSGVLSVTVLGAEEYEPYNRVLLSEVVAGNADVASLTLPRPPAPAAGTEDQPPVTVTVHRGASAVAVDRQHRTVLDDDGGRHPYDVLVLATGARARVPEIPGLVGSAGQESSLPAGVHALRTLDDAREIVAATVNARRAVVLGGGVLGLEAACGLARRGLAVTVVHRGAHLMDRQLGAGSADAVGHGLDRLGIEHVTGATTEEVVVRDGALRAVRVTAAHDAAVDLTADLLVLTTGTVPETGLARRAGLRVDHGVVVGPDGATSDPAVYALGDCAQPPEGGTGLIAQGWDQARRLAQLLTRQVDGAPGPAPGAQHGTDVVRLKAHGLEVVAMGVCGSGRRGAAGTRTLQMSDPDVGRHVEVVVRDGVVVGATCVGAGALASDLATAYSRRTPTPRDPAQLLVKAVRGAAGDPADEPSPTLMPDRATVCRCNGVTKGDIVACWRHGARSVADVSRATRATTGCGGCTDAVCGIVDWLERSDPPGVAAAASGTSAPAGGASAPAGGAPAGSARSSRTSASQGPIPVHAAP